MRVLVTGVTGLLGSSLVPPLLQRGHEVVVAARRRGPLAAESRVRGILAALGVTEESRARVEVLDLGTSSSLGAVLLHRPPFDSVLHAAAAVKFGASPQELLRVNLDATRRLLRALDGTSPKAFFHFISTAYVCGERTGVVFEHERHVGQRFRNAYEASKAAAEQLVEDECSQSGRPWAIHRPSIIGGRSRDGATANFNGILTLLRMVGRIGMDTAIPPGSLTIRCDPQSTKNIVPVDWLAEVIANLVERATPGATYHLTHPCPLSHAQIARMLREVIDSPWLVLESADWTPDAANVAQRLLDRAMKSFTEYLWGEPTFDRRDLERALGVLATPPAIDTRYLRGLFSFGARTSWHPRPLEASIPILQEAGPASVFVPERKDSGFANRRSTTRRTA